MEFIEKYHRSEISGTEIGELGLRYCGRRLDAPNHSFGPAARDNYWLIYIKSGEGIYETGDMTHRVCAGELFCAFPNRRIYYKADEGSVWSIYWVSLAGARVGQYLKLAGIDEENPVVKVSEPDAAVESFESLLSLIDVGTLQSKLECNSLLYRLLSQLGRSEGLAVRMDYFDEALLYMSNNYVNPITVSDIARRLNLDRSYFARMFRRRSGKSPNRWLTEHRLGRACELLEHTNLHISEIAHSVGYTDPLYFTRIFTKTYGTPPTAWRESCGRL